MASSTIEICDLSNNRFESELSLKVVARILYALPWSQNKNPFNFFKAAKSCAPLCGRMKKKCMSQLVPKKCHWVDEIKLKLLTWKIHLTPICRALNSWCTACTPFAVLSHSWHVNVLWASIVIHVIIAGIDIQIALNLQNSVIFFTVHLWASKWP